MNFVLIFINYSPKAITIGNDDDKLTLVPLPDENGKSVKLIDDKDIVVVEETYSDDENPDYLTIVKIS